VSSSPYAAAVRATSPKPLESLRNRLPTRNCTQTSSTVTARWGELAATVELSWMQDPLDPPDAWDEQQDDDPRPRELELGRGCNCGDLFDPPTPPPPPLLLLLPAIPLLRRFRWER
jgi:hypothetical protein